MSCSFMMKTHGSFQAIVNARDLLNYLHETLISRVSESPPPETRAIYILYGDWGQILLLVDQSSSNTVL